MNNSDIIKLIRILSANYRKWPEEGKEEDTALLWEMMLSDMPLDVAQKAVKMHMSRSVYPPTVADIRDCAAKITQPRMMEAIEAWDLIVTAIRRFGFYREGEAMESLPADVALMTKRFGWRDLCLSENVDTLRAQFRMAWETQNKRAKEQNILPAELLDLIESPNLLKRLS